AVAEPSGRRFDSFENTLNTSRMIRERAAFLGKGRAREGDGCSRKARIGTQRVYDQHLEPLEDRVEAFGCQLLEHVGAAYVKALELAGFSGTNKFLNTVVRSCDQTHLAHSARVRRLLSFYKKIISIAAPHSHRGSTHAHR